MFKKIYKVKTQNMKYVKQILNFLLKVSFFYLFFATWIGLYCKNKSLTITLSILLTILVILVLQLITKKRQKVKNIKQNEKKQIEITLENLRCLQKSEQTKFIKKIANLTSKNYYINLEEPTLAINAYYLIVKQALKQKSNSIKVFCVDLTTELLAKCQSQSTLNIEFFDKFDIYKLCKEKNIYPPQTIIQKSQSKITLKVLLSNILNKKRAKQYFAFSVLMLIFSFFTFFKIYYLVSSSIFLMLSLFCLFEDKLKSKKVIQQK